MSTPFALGPNYVQLSDGADARRVPVSCDFWERIGETPELHQGRLVTFFHLGPDIVHWEMHPKGDEILFLISGATAVVLDDGRAKRRVRLKAGEAFIVPRGVWHKFEIEAPGNMLAITRGAGTELRDG